jgi:hypothetical protein
MGKVATLNINKEISIVFLCTSNRNINIFKILFTVTIESSRNSYKRCTTYILLINSKATEKLSNNIHQDCVETISQNLEFAFLPNTRDRGLRLQFKNHLVGNIIL